MQKWSHNCSRLSCHVRSWCLFRGVPVTIQGFDPADAIQGFPLSLFRGLILLMLFMGYLSRYSGFPPDAIQGFMQPCANVNNIAAHTGQSNRPKHGIFHSKNIQIVVIICGGAFSLLKQSPVHQMTCQHACIIIYNCMKISSRYWINFIFSCGVSWHQLMSLWQPHPQCAWTAPRV